MVFEIIIFEQLSSYCFVLLFWFFYVLFLPYFYAQIPPLGTSYLVWKFFEKYAIVILATFQGLYFNFFSQLSVLIFDRCEKEVEDGSNAELDDLNDQSLFLHPGKFDNFETECSFFSYPNHVGLGAGGGEGKARSAILVQRYPTRKLFNTSIISGHFNFIKQYRLFTI